MPMRTISLLLITAAILLLVQAAGATAASLEIGDVEINPDGTLTARGTTNIAPGNELLVDIVSSGFGATSKETSRPFYGSSGTVEVEAGEPYNTWAYTFEMLPPEAYTITVEWVGGDATASGTFTITSETASEVTAAAPSPATTMVPPPATPNPTQAPWGAAGVIISLVAAVLMRRS
ncbi:hypothetical protein [uncultured Methanofollis sp.]|uniref:hypothetical protein n=1 Tax=uncultured Methanofollis sp. TaxID=262500 RepID=UPI0026390AF9|nr:hypothetical protein [uncultured Methanofollis sp.]